MTEFASRPPLHEGGFVGEPSHLAPDRGHYTRWASTATTFGPGMRVGVTVVLLALLAAGFFELFFMLWFVQLFTTAWVVKDIWRKGWAPASQDAPHREPAVGVAVITEGLRMPPAPENVEPVPTDPRTSSEKAGLVLLCFAGAAVACVFVWGSPQMRKGAIAFGVLLGMYSFYRSFLT